VSLWSRLRARLGGAEKKKEEDAAARALREVADPSEAGGVGAPARGHAARAAPEGKAKDEAIALLRRAGLPDGPSVDEAIALLRRARGTAREADAIEAVMSAMGERPLGEPIRVACADILAARGDEPAALKVLEGLAGEGVTGTSGLVLAADLYAALGQLPRAVSTIERVLGRELDAPGARERHRRWRVALGVPEGRAGHRDEATVVAATPDRGPFRLLREVARGGAGAVYEAEDELLGRRVAFKVYHRRGDDRSLLEREIRTASALAGPGVVRVFDASPAEGWIAVEWIARGSVRDVLRSGDVAALLPIARWARPLARAIARVHAAGVAHADVKPANVLLRQLAEPVLGDFGIARPFGEAGDAGSPGYVSPERLAGRASDPRDDIYGFGRVIEDVLHAAEARGAAIDGGELKAMRAFAARCIGPDAERPADGSELVRALP
jgi:serine/threonine-protein kinase